MTFSASWFCPGPPLEEGGGENWCLYNTFKMLVTTPSVVASAVVGTWIWQKRRRLNKEDPRRTRTLADFFDKLVIILFIIDFIGSLIEYIYVFDTNAFPLKYWDPERRGPVNTILYVELLEAQCMFNAFAHCYISYIMYSFIGRRRSLSRLKRDAPPKKMLAIACLGVVLYGVFWTVLWKYAVAHDSFRHIFIAGFAVDLLAFPPAIVFMLIMYWLTWRALKGRATSDDPNSFLSGRYARIRRKLMLVAIVIPSALSIGSAMDFIHWSLWMQQEGHGQTSIIVTFIRLAAFRSIGLLDALIFGGAFDVCLDGNLKKSMSKVGSGLFSRARRLDHRSTSQLGGERMHEEEEDTGEDIERPGVIGGAQGGASGKIAQSRRAKKRVPPPPKDQAMSPLIRTPSRSVHSPLPPSLNSLSQSPDISQDGALSPPPPPVPVPSPSFARGKVFISTCNVGGCSDVRSFGSIPAWVPRGYDLYILGFQEALILDSLRIALHDHLGGPAVYEMFCREIGDATILNGMIAITIFARTVDIQRGAVVVARSASGTVNTGMSLGIMGRAANKGTVGLSVRYHDLSIACITAHFAADKHGHSRVTRRNQDAVQTLRELSLTYDNEDFDAHLQHDVAILLGDLNYRLTAKPLDILRRVSESAAVEAAWWQSQTASPIGRDRERPRAVALDKGGNEHQGIGTGRDRTWRDCRYRSLMFGEAEEESEWQEGGKEDKERAGSDRDGVEAPTSPARDVADSKQEAFLEPSSPKPGKEESHCQHEQGQPVDVSGCTRNHSSVHSTRQPNYLLPVDTPPASLPHHVNSLPSETQAADAEEQEAPSSPVGPDLTSSAYPSDSPSSMLPAPSRLANMRQRHISFTAAEALYLSREASEGEGREVRSKGGRKGGRKERQLMDAWSWIGKCDELSRAMETGDLLFGFHEAPIRFPPSFRWVSGASAGDFTQLSLLEKCFTLKAFSKKSGWTPRPPSYTDRILFHALPDVGPRVFIQGYDMCDAITGSDHRPVVCRVDLKLNTDIIGFNTVPQVSSHLPSLSHCSSSSSSLPSMPLSSSSASHEISPGRVKPPRVFSRLRHETTGDEEVERRKPRNHENKPVPPQHQGPQGLSPLPASALQGRDPPAPGREVGKEGGQDAAAMEAAEPVGGGEGGGHERGKRRDRACETGLLPRGEEAISANGPARPAPLGASSTSYSSSFLSTVASRFHSAYLKRARPPSSSPLYHAVLAGPRASPLLQASNSHLRPVFKPYTGALAIWTVELTHLLLVGDSDDNDIDVPEYDEMTVLFPVSAEDPFAWDRKSIALDESFLDMPRMARRAGSGHSASSAGGESSPIRQKDGESQEETITHLVHSVHRISHRSLQLAHEQSPTSQGLSMTVRAIVAPAFTRHLLIKLTDYKGRDIGQGVISLPPALPPSLLPCSSSAPGVHLYVPLSLGAQPQTVLLSLRCRVTEKPFHAPTREGGFGRMGQRRGEERGGEAQA